MAAVPGTGERIDLRDRARWTARAWVTYKIWLRTGWRSNEIAALRWDDLGQTFRVGAIASRKTGTVDGSAGNRNRHRELRPPLTQA